MYQEDEGDLHSVLKQINSIVASEPNDVELPSFESNSAEFAPDSWEESFKKFRKPLPKSKWKWSEQSLPGKYCDLHLLNFMQCLDATKDKLLRGEPPEKFCGEAKDMTAACMIQTLCENKIFKVSKYCRENGDPDKRDPECWIKLWEAQSCAQMSQLLLSKRVLQSRLDAISPAERYFILLGAKNVPGKQPIDTHKVTLKKEDLQKRIKDSELKQGDIPYYTPR